MPGQPTYGEGFIDLKPSLDKSFGSSITNALGPVGKAAGLGFVTAFTAVVGGGVLLEGIGASFDDAFDTIRVGTGATGEALEGLKEEFRDVVSSVPTDFGNAGQAIADINTRLGLTGDDLEDLSTQFLELSRITDTDLGANVETVSRTFGDWAIDTEDMASAMDSLFRASQATGPPVDQLGSLLVQYGAPLRQLGFGFEESAALLGKFEKEGVNTELVMGSLRVALGKMAREGEDAQETFARVVGQIEDAGSASEANAIALELFGARAGPDMAAAIREGRFELGELFTQVTEGTETILGAAEDTNSWRESLQVLKNQALVALEPAATAVFEGIGSAIERFTPQLQSAAAWLGENIPRAIQWLTDAWDIVSGVVGPIIERIVEFIANLRSEGVEMGGEFQGILEALAAKWQVVFEIIQDITAAAVEWFEANRDDIERIWGQVQEFITKVAEALRLIFEGVTAAITWIWDNFGENIIALFRNAWDTVAGVLSGVISILTGILDTLIGLFTGDWSRMRDGLVGIWEGLWDTIVSVIRGVFGQVRAVFGDLIANVTESGRDIVRGIWEGIKSMGGWLVDRLTGFVTDHIPGPIARALGISSPSKVMAALGVEIPRGLVVGIDRGAAAVEASARGLASRAIPDIAGTAGNVLTADTPTAATSGGALFRDLVVTTQADPQTIAAEIAWQQRTAGV